MRPRPRAARHWVCHCQQLGCMRLDPLRGEWAAGGLRAGRAGACMSAAAGAQQRCAARTAASAAPPRTVAVEDEAVDAVDELQLVLVRGTARAWGGRRRSEQCR